MCYTMVKRGGEGGENMHIYEAENRTPELISQLVAVWETSVRETHLCF